MAFVAAVLIMFSTIISQSASMDGSAQDWSDVLASVSSERTMDTIRDLEAFGSRAFHLNASKDAASLIYQRFSGLGLQTSIQNFTFGDVSTCNVVAVIPGSGATERTLLFGAHYDSENRLATNLSLTQGLAAPGADDDASGVAAVIELATVLSGVTASDTLKFVAFGAEELGYDQTGGLRGSRYFVAQEKADGVVYESAVILDMVGYRDSDENRITIVNRNSSDRLAPLAVQVADAYGLDLTIEPRTSEVIDYSDHASFWNVDYEAVLVTEELEGATRPYPLNPYYHTAYDTSDKLSETQIVEVIRCMAAVALDLAEAEDLSAATVDASEAAALAAVVVVAIAVPIAFRARRSNRKRIP